MVCKLTGQVLVNGLHGGHEAPPDLHGVGSMGNTVEAGLGDGPGQDSGGSGTVTCLFVGVVGYILDQFGSHVLELVLELDGFGNRHAILGDLGTAP